MLLQVPMPVEIGGEAARNGAFSVVTSTVWKLLLPSQFTNCSLLRSFPHPARLFLCFPWGVKDISNYTSEFVLILDVLWVFIADWIL